MKKITLGRTPLQSAPIALGCMRMASLDVREAERVVNTALEQGIDLFDHADIYGGGRSEEIFGEVLARNPGMRERMLVQGKCGICKGYYDASKEHILEAVDGILGRLKVEYLDTLLLHRPDALMEPEEVAEAVARLKAAGKIRHFGVSNQNAEQMQLLNRWLDEPVAIDQLQFSLAHSGMVDAGVNVNVHSDHAVVRDGSVLDFCRLNDVTIQAWSPFQFGMFKGVFIGSPLYPELNAALTEIAQAHSVTESAIAVAWILRHPARIQTILGSMNPGRIREISAALSITLTRPEWYRLYRSVPHPLP